MAWGKETDYQTAVAAVRYFEATENIKGMPNFDVPEPVASPDYRNYGPDAWRYKGDVGPFKVPPDVLGDMLSMVFGLPTTTTPSAGVYLHSFAPLDALPSYTIRRGLELTESVLAGCLGNSLTLKLNRKENALQATLGVLQGYPEASATIKTESQLNALLSSYIPFPFDSPSTYLISTVENKLLMYDLSVALNNNFLEEGNLDSNNLTQKRKRIRDVTGTISLCFDNTTERDRFLAGTPFGLNVTVYGPLIASTYRYSLNLQLPRCRYTEDALPHVKTQKEGLMIANAPFRAFYDTTSSFNASVKAALQNAVVSY
jgi:hypothetical protein